MRKSTLMKLLSLVLCAMMVLSLFACVGNEEKPTDTETEKKTEAPTEKPTEAPTESQGTESQGTESQGTESQGTESQGTESQETESQETESQETESQETESQETESQETDSQETESETETETFEHTPDDGHTHSWSRHGVYRCTLCGFIPECKGEHPYVKDATGHWKAACDKCGKAVGSVQDHEFAGAVEEADDETTYTYACTVCGYVGDKHTISNDINSFYFAGDLVGKGTGIVGSFVREPDMGYVSFPSTAGGNFTLPIVEAAEPEEASGYYLALKIRLPKSQRSFNLTIKSLSAAASQTVTVNDLKIGWTVIIIDITKIISTNEEGAGIGYQPDNSGEFYLSDLSISANVGTNETFDISYVMLCDSVEDAKAYAEGERRIYTFYDILNPEERPELEEEPCRDENGNLVEHKITVNNDGTHSIAACPYCGLAAVENEPHAFAAGFVEQEGVRYMAYTCNICEFAHKVKVPASVNYYGDLETMTCWAGHGTIFERYQYDEEGGFLYNKITVPGNGDDNNSKETEVFITGGKNIALIDGFEHGRYMLIKYRSSAPEVMKFAEVGKNENESRNLGFLGSTGGQWRVAIVDMNELINDNLLFTDPDALYIKMVVNQQADIAYLAMTDTLAEVKEFVTDEKVVICKASTSNQWHVPLIVTEMNTADLDDNMFVDPCEDGHTLTVTSESVEGGTKYSYTCSKCDFTHETIIPAGVNYINDLTAMKWYSTNGTINVGKFDSNENVLYNSVTAVENLDIMIFVNGKNGATETTYPAGRYVLLKYRTYASKSAETWVKFMAVGTSNEEGKNSNLGFVGATDGAWRVAVIDIGTLLGEGETTLYLNLLARGKIDIAYLAIVDSFEEIDALVTDSVIHFGVPNTETGHSQISLTEKKPDGTCASHNIVLTSAAVAGGTEYTYSCSACGLEYKTTVPESAKFFCTLDNMGYWPGNNPKVDRYSYDEENGILYNSFSNKGDVALFIGNPGSEQAPTEGTYQPGKYFVIKYRTNPGDNYLLLDHVGSDLDNNKPIGQLTGTNGEWRVVVIDLSKLDKWPTEESTLFMYFTAVNHTDIAYVATFAELADIKGLVEADEDILYLTKPAGDRMTAMTLIKISLGVLEGTEQPENPNPCESGHTVTEVTSAAVEGGTEYTYACTECDFVYKTTVPTSAKVYVTLDKIGKYSPFEPEYLLNSYDKENNVLYNGYNAKGDILIAPLNTKGVASAPGRYMVMKYRMAADGYLLIDQVGSSDSKEPIGRLNTTNGEWRVVVIDLETVKNWPKAESALYIGFTAVNQIDLAYVATFDELADVKGILAKSDAKILYMATPVSDRSTEMPIVRITLGVLDGTEQPGENILCEGGHTVTEVTSAAVEGGTEYTYACTACNLVYKTTVPSSINYYSDLQTINDLPGNNNAEYTKYVYDEDNNVLYNSITIPGGKVNLLYFTGNEFRDADLTNARYLVLKYRMPDNANINFTSVQTSKDGEDVTTKSFYEIYSTGGKWRVVVLDLGDAIKNAENNQINITATVANTADIAYIAVTDTLAEVKGLLTEKDGIDGNDVMIRKWNGSGFGFGGSVNDPATDYTADTLLDDEKFG